MFCLSLFNWFKVPSLLLFIQSSMIYLTDLLFLLVKIIRPRKVYNRNLTRLYTNGIVTMQCNVTLSEKKFFRVLARLCGLDFFCFDLIFYSLLIISIIIIFNFIPINYSSIIHPLFIYQLICLFEISLINFYSPYFFKFLLIDLVLPASLFLFLLPITIIFNNFL